MITALSLMGLHGPRRMQVSVLRLVAVVTARYNWRADELSMGQAEMARIWGVTERTVKREVRSWIDARLVVRTRPATRGRVGAYRLDLDEIRGRSADLWPHVGPDYADRMAADRADPSPGPDAATPGQGALPHEAEEEDCATGCWAAVRGRIRRHNPAVYRHWIAPLRFVSDDGRCVTLHAPTRFVAHYVSSRLGAVLDDAVEAEIGPLRRVAIVDGAAAAAAS